jgi:2-polyprenyl-3-methyl-5-hydroxy-6-metoxy-1,4-benzoquinol methylase
MNAIAEIYEDKPRTYFGGVRLDIIKQLTTDASSAILELGCGNGGTGLATISAGKAGRYVGIELDPMAAEMARRVLSSVIVGDVAEANLLPHYGKYDALILSEVLEHLTDPWVVLGRMVRCLKPGGMVYASSPNISHWRVIAGLIRGQFGYAPDGVMDRTHLRWFTPNSFRELFEEAGVSVASVAPLVHMRPKARLLNALTGGRFSHLFSVQIMLVGCRV